MFQGVPLNQIFPPELMRLFPLGLALMVMMIYSLFVFFVYYLQSSFTFVDNMCVINGTICILILYWCLYLAAKRDPGYTIQGDAQDEEGIISEQSEKVCQICQSLKPERAHHCSKCKRCVLNMDHHCVWTANCVGLKNRKPFVLILFWGSLGMLHATLIGVYNFDRIYERASNNYTNEEYFQLFVRLITMFVIITQFFNMIGLWYFFMKNLMFVLKNITTIDEMRVEIARFQNVINPIDIQAYDQGCQKNFEFYFGEHPLLWFFPVGKPQGDGYKWTKRQNSDSDKSL